MKTKTILVLSLASNAVLLSALGYINTLSVEPADTPAFIRYVTNSPLSVVEQPVNSSPVSGETVATLPQP
jgi:hypothetical protein